MTVQDNYQKAIDFAARAHGDQLVPGRPYSYIVHASNVAMEILCAAPHGGGIDTALAATCALLHDVLEDTGTQYEQLRDAFGETVASGVRALTKNASLGKAGAMEDSIRRILEQGPEIGMVKLADRITNLQEPPAGWDRAKREKYLDEARLIHDRLKHCSEYLAQRLKQKIEGYKEYL